MRKNRSEELAGDCARTAECANTEARNSRRCLNIHLRGFILTGECDIGACSGSRIHWRGGILAGDCDDRSM